jgi:glycosyltransferase involved in cell wall biosynthesis
MRISVLINNHNYGRYLGEAVESASLQVLAPHEVIVVDDGSTDDSRSILDSIQRKDPALVCHRQENMGQLAALRAGAERASGEWCALLDSDDTWTSRHLDVLRETRSRHPDIGIYFSGHTETEGPPLYRTVWPPVPLGPVPAFVAATGLRFGSITSAICLRTDLLREIVAATRPLEAEWRISADDVIIYGAALSATRLFHGDTPTVRYRIHGENNFAGNNNRAAQNEHGLRRERVIDVLRTRQGMNEENLLPLLLEEWRRQRATAPEALRKRYRRGLRKRSLRAWLASFL